MALSIHDPFQAGRRGRRARRGQLSEINVTPLVDVMLVLLIIFMISAPLLTVGVPLQLPKTEAGAMQDQTEPLTVSVRTNGDVFLNDTQVPFSALSPALRQMTDAGFKKPIYVRADGRAPYAVVAQVMAAISSSGFSNINLITDTGGPSSGPKPSASKDDTAPGRRPALSMTWREHDNRAPALLAAAALHVGLFGLLLIAPKAMPLPPVGSSVPINIVSTDPYTDSRPAVQAPQTQAAAAPTPVPKAQPQPPAQVAAPPAFSAAPKTKPQHEKPIPAQASLHPTKPSDASPDLLNHLQSIIANAQRTAGPPASSAQKGPPRQETAPQARPNAGQGVMQSDIVGLDQLLGRLWNPNCEAPGGADVRFSAKFTVDMSGKAGRPDLGGLENSANPVIYAAARRAIAAIHQVEPYDPKFRGQPIIANFNAREACSKR